MSALLEKTSIQQKTVELCEQIANDPQFTKSHGDVERFMADEPAKTLYQSVHQKGEELHNKQQAQVELSATEIKEFEALRDSLFNNKLAADFMDAQRSLETMQKEINQTISMTLELGRVPTEEEIAEAQHAGGGCCGGSGGSDGGCCS